MIRLARFAACCAVLGAVACAPSAFAECVYPKAPTSYPDGRTATKEDMIAGQGAVKQFMKDADAYMSCVDSENPPPADQSALTPEQKKAIAAREEMRVKKHNAAVSDEEKVSAQFNEQLHIWKETQAKK